MDTISGCICLGNWRNIVKENSPFLGRKYSDSSGNEYTFFGIVHGPDDYYYGMWELTMGKVSLLSCVGSIEGFGYKLIE